MSQDESWSSDTGHQIGTRGLPDQRRFRPPEDGISTHLIVPGSFGVIGYFRKQLIAGVFTGYLESRAVGNAAAERQFRDKWTRSIHSGRLLVLFRQPACLPVHHVALVLPAVGVGELLRQISKLELKLVPTHPDGSCGLGFLDGIVLAMAPFLLSQSLLLSGYVANRIFYADNKLPDHHLEVGVLAALLALIALGPLCVFTPPLLRARRLGLLNYGRLASDYVVGFDRKWIPGDRPADEPLVGGGDIPSPADLANSFSVVRSITPTPFGRSSLIGLAAIIALPLLPLTLTMFSLEELAVRLLKILL